MAAPTPLEFYVGTPLYEPVYFDEDLDHNAAAILWCTGPLDIYCPECDQHSIFKRYVSGTFVASDWLGFTLVNITFKCSRDSNHQLVFWLRIDGESRTIEKVGQLPSLATLCMYDVQKYKAVLEKDTFRELTKAIGLAAHGVGVGSFVYLRRIFEGLVEQAHVQAQQLEEWDEKAYWESRMAEKIQLLHAFLPDFLVRNRLIYAILSKGIHELSEEECLQAFPAMKVGIEIILDEKLRRNAEERKMAEAAKAIQNFNALHGKG